MALATEHKSDSAPRTRNIIALVALIATLSGGLLGAGIAGGKSYVDHGDARTMEKIDAHAALPAHAVSMEQRDKMMAEVAKIQGELNGMVSRLTRIEQALDRLEDRIK